MPTSFKNSCMEKKIRQLVAHLHYSLAIFHNKRFGFSFFSSSCVECVGIATSHSHDNEEYFDFNCCMQLHQFES